MAQAQVSNTIRDLSGQALSQSVTVDIAPIGTGPFITPEGNELVGPLSFQTDKTGNWTKDLERTDTLFPLGTLFLVTEHLPSGKHTYKIAVPGPGPYRVSDPGIIQSTLPIPANAPWITASLPFAFGTPGGPLELYLNQAGGISSGSPLDLLGGQPGFAGPELLLANNIARWLLPSALTPIANNGTITMSGSVVRVQTTNNGNDNVTGVIVAPGQPGQKGRIVNEGPGTIQFAVLGTSNVAPGTRGVIQGNSYIDLYWNDQASTHAWYTGVGAVGSARIVVAAAGASDYAKRIAQFQCGGAITGGVLTPTTIDLGIQATLLDNVTTTMTVTAVASLAAILAQGLTLVVGTEHIKLVTAGASGLTASLNSTLTTTMNTSGAGSLAIGQTVQIGTEQLTITAGVGTAWTVTRGVNGTTPAQHNAGSVLYVIGTSWTVQRGVDNTTPVAHTSPTNELSVITNILVGATGDEAQIQAANDLLVTIGAGTVELVGPRFIQAKEIQKHENVSIEGQGWSTVLQRGDNVNCHSITNKNANVQALGRVYNLTVDGNMRNNGFSPALGHYADDPRNRGAIVFTSMIDPLVDHVRVINAQCSNFPTPTDSRAAIQFTACLRPTAINCEVSNCNGMGLRSALGSYFDPTTGMNLTEGLFIANQVHDCAFWIFDMDGGQIKFIVMANRIWNCVCASTGDPAIDGYREGLVVDEGASGFTVSGNQIWLCLVGLVIQTDFVTGTNQSHTVFNNACFKNYNQGINVNSNAAAANSASLIRGLLVIGNLLYDNGHAGYAGSAGIQTNTASGLSAGVTGTTDAATGALATSAAGDLAIGQTIVLDAERMTITAGAGTSWTVTRGVNGTALAAHTSTAISHSGSVITGAIIALNRAFDTGAGVQLNGIHLTTSQFAVNDTQIWFNDVRGNINGGILIDGAGTFTGTIRWNPGYTTETGINTTLLPAGSTSVQVTHGLATAPAFVTLSGQNGTGTGITGTLAFASSTTMTTSGAGDLASGQTVQLDGEQIAITGGAGTSWTVNRAQNGTVAVAHNNAAIIHTGATDAATGTLTTSGTIVLSVGQTVLLDQEQMTVTGGSGNSWGVTRAVNGTTIAAHTHAAIYTVTTALALEWGAADPTHFTVFSNTPAPAGGKLVSWEAKAAHWY